MQNDYLGQAADKLDAALTRYEFIEKKLREILSKAGANPLPTDRFDILGRIEDAIDECAGDISQINEALLEADLSASAYHQTVGHNLRAGA